MPAICVFGASSDGANVRFANEAAELGAEIARRGYELVYGGGRHGLIGVLARAAHANGGRVIGVIPVRFREQELAYEESDELIVTQDMRERKKIMESRADAFIGLPGGFGTLEEILEILTLRQLQFHHKPVALINTDHFYDRLIHLFEHVYEQEFAVQEHRETYHISPDVHGAITYIEEQLHNKRT